MPTVYTGSYKIPFYSGLITGQNTQRELNLERARQDAREAANRNFQAQQNAASRKLQAEKMALDQSRWLASKAEEERQFDLQLADKQAAREQKVLEEQQNILREDRRWVADKLQEEGLIQGTPEFQQRANELTLLRRGAYSTPRQAQQVTKPRQPQPDLGVKDEEEVEISTITDYDVQLDNLTTNQSKYRVTSESWKRFEKQREKILDKKIKLQDDVLDKSDSLRKEFEKKSEVKDYVGLSRNTDLINEVNTFSKTLDEKESQNFVDQSLMFLFNKILDPISVVRESEFERSAKGQSWYNRFKGAWNKVLRGGAGLSNSEREALIDIVNVMNNKAYDRYKKVEKRYIGLAGKYGIDDISLVINPDIEIPQQPTTKKKVDEVIPKSLWLSKFQKTLQG